LHTKSSTTIIRDTQLCSLCVIVVGEIDIDKVSYREARSDKVVVCSEW